MPIGFYKALDDFRQSIKQINLRLNIVGVLYNS